MALYKYYQNVGGTEKWHLTRSETDLKSTSPTFVTILSLDTLGTLPEDEPTKELLSGTKYLGPMYFDLDAKDLEESIEGANELVDKLLVEGLAATDFDIYLSGKKGLHIIISSECFMEKQQPVQFLPAIYKEIAFKLATNTVDFAVYTARSGRMLRTCHNIRENGNYRVPISLDELRGLTPETYVQFCRTPRISTVAVPEFRPAFALIYDAAKQKVMKHSNRKAKPVDAKTIQLHLPIVQQIMRGEVAPGVGFNKVAIQVAIYARDSGMSVETLVTSCEGLINTHSGDGNRYDTPSKRENEIRRMWDYVEGNTSYEYSINPLKAMLPKVGAVSAEPVYDDEGCEIPQPMVEQEDAFSNGVSEMGNQYVATKGDAGDMAITNFIFTDVTKLVMLGTEEIIGLKAVLMGAGVKKPPVILSTAQFTGSSGLQNAVSPHGGSFSGTDIHARGILQLMLHRVTTTKYIIDSEGVNLISLPLSANEQLREPFVVWADSFGVRVPAWVEDAGVQFDFAGHPDAKGVLQTDLTNAPTLNDYTAMSDDHKQNVIDTLKALMHCQSPEVIGKLLGWMVATFWRQQFDKLHNKFPLLHVYGPAGLGKTEVTTALLSLFYYKVNPKSMAASSTPFALTQLVSGSGSIPILLDEYKPSKMDPAKLEGFKTIFREAYNMKDSVRGGGNRTTQSYNALNRVSLTGPIIFMGEAPDTETALLERCVLVSIKKATPEKHQKRYMNSMRMQRSKEVFSSIGHSLASSVLADDQMHGFANAFNTLHDKAVQKLMVQDDDAARLASGELTKEEFHAKKNAAPRAIYSNTVAMFGLMRLKRMLKQALPEEFDDVFGEDFIAMQTGIFSGMNDHAANMVPEYIKLLTTMGDMTQLASDDRLRLVEGLEYNLSEIGGRPVLALVPRAAYSKYRMYCRNAGLEYFYAEERSFTQAAKEVPQFLKTGLGTAKARVETLIFDLEDLQRSGVSTWAGKAVTLPS